MTPLSVLVGSGLGRQTRTSIWEHRNVNLGANAEATLNAISTLNTIRRTVYSQQVKWPISKRWYEDGDFGRHSLGKHQSPHGLKSVNQGSNPQWCPTGIIFGYHCSTAFPKYNAVLISQLPTTFHVPDTHISIQVFQLP